VCLSMLIYQDLGEAAHVVKVSVPPPKARLSVSPSRRFCTKILSSTNDGLEVEEGICNLLIDTSARKSATFDLHCFVR